MKNTIHRVRNRTILFDKIVSDLRWATVARLHNLSVTRVRQIVAQELHRRRREYSESGVGATVIILKDLSTGEDVILDVFVESSEAPDIIRPGKLVTLQGYRPTPHYWGWRMHGVTGKWIRREDF